MTLKYGSNLGLLAAGDPGEQHYQALLQQWRGLDALVQPSVIARVAALSSTGLQDGDRYLLTTPNANADKIARYSTALSPAGWEYFTPKSGWIVWSASDQRAYRFKGDPLAWQPEVAGGGSWPELADKPANLVALADLQGTAGRGIRFTAPGVMETFLLGSFASADYAAAPFINLMPDSGRFAGKINPTDLAITAAFTPSSYFPAFNGASLSSAGKFITDNSTNGGAAGALTESVQSLLQALGRQGDVARYGVEFYVLSLTAGQGTSVGNVGSDGVTRYPPLVMQKAIACASNYATFTSWIRAKSGSVHITVPTYVDSVLRPAGWVVPAGWHHVRLVSSSAYGYFSLLPYMFTAPGTVLEFALPAYFHGIVDAGQHRGPLLTINEMNS